MFGVGSVAIYEFQCWTDTHPTTYYIRVFPASPSPPLISWHGDVSDAVVEEATGGPVRTLQAWQHLAADWEADITRNGDFLITL